MVYDDTRWVARLKNMGLWSDLEAKRRFEEAIKRKRDAATRTATNAGPISADKEGSTTIFDAAIEEERRMAAAAQLLDSQQPR